MRRLDKLDMKPKHTDRAKADELLRRLQLDTLELTLRCRERGERVILLFEGWDAAGKGGCIQRLTSHLDPHLFKVHAIGAPDDHERREHYLKRFFERLPLMGEWSIFDRTWYGRVLVERIEGLCPEKRWKQAYEEINDLERMLVDDGIRLFKFFLHVSADEQLRRFKDRESSPWKRWKLTEDDWRNREKRAEYLEAYEDMFERTDTQRAPWHIIAAEHKPDARITVLKKLVEGLA